MPDRRELSNANRALSMDAVQQANSGHSGAPKGMADMAEVLWNHYHSHNPANPANPADPDWADRDSLTLFAGIRPACNFGDRASGNKDSN